MTRPHPRVSATYNLLLKRILVFVLRRDKNLQHNTHCIKHIVKDRIATREIPPSFFAT